MKLKIQIVIDATITGDNMDDLTAFGLKKLAEIMKGAQTKINAPCGFAIDKVITTSKTVED